MVSMRGVLNLVGGLCVGVLIAVQVQAQPPAPAVLGDPAANLPSGQQMLGPLPGAFIERVSPGVFRFGDIRIENGARAVIFPASVNMDKGLLEYLIVRSSGKVHESLLRTHVDPYHLQLALLLLGFEGTDQPISAQGAPEKPKGERIEIIIEYSKKEGTGSSGRIDKVKAEEWVARKNNGDLKSPGPLDWVYTGSLVVQGQFLAQSSGSIAAIYRDPGALIDNASAGGESDEIWFVKEGTVPPAGTPVTVVIRAKK